MTRLGVLPAAGLETKGLRIRGADGEGTRDWRARGAKRKGRAGVKGLSDMRAKIEVPAETRQQPRRREFYRGSNKLARLCGWNGPTKPV
jgi:hypothetical protein